MKHINAGVDIDIDTKFIKKCGISWAENGSIYYLLAKISHKKVGLMLT